MKPSRILSIYIASSFRNLHAVDMLMHRLRESGHLVLDWTKLSAPLPSGLQPAERRALLDSDARGRIFDFCAQACAGADLVIYLGPSGQDAACEAGMAFNAGVLVYGLPGPLEAPGLILSRAVSRWFEDVDELLAAVEVFAEDTVWDAANALPTMPGGAA